jgi:hypothetical protein
MIITKQLVESLREINLLCDDGIAYILNNDCIGMTRTQFIEKARNDSKLGKCSPDYLTWSINTLVKHPLIKHHPDFVPTGKFRVLGLEEIFYDIGTACIALQKLKDKNSTTSYLYCVEEETMDSSDPTDPQTSWRLCS